MNCERAGELMALYVEGDLAAPDTRAVTAHLAQCEDCRRLAEEYRDSQAWLRSLAAPELPDDALAQMRRAVREEIEAPRFLESIGYLAAIFGRPALAFLLLLLVGAGLSAYLALRGNPAGPVAGSVEDPPGAVTAAESERKEAPVPEAPKVSDLAADADAPRGGRSGRPISRKGIPPFVAPPNIALIGALPAELAARVDLPAPDSTQLVAGVSDGAPAEEFLRIEIQTADPQVRIIWFAPKSNENSASRPVTY